MPNIIFPYIEVLTNKKTNEKLRDNIQYDKCINLSQTYQETFNFSLNNICELIINNNLKKK